MVNSTILLVICLYYILKQYKASGNLFNLSILFNSLCIFYVFVGCNIYFYEYKNDHDYLIEIINATSVSMFFFNLFYSITSPIYQKKRKTPLPSINVIYFLFFMCCLINLFFILVSSKSLLTTRTDSFNLFYENKFIFLVQSTQTVIYIYLAYFHYLIRRNKLFTVATSYLLLFSIINISRFDLLIIIFTHIFFLYHTKRISTIKIINYGSLLIFIFLFLKPVLYKYLLNINYGQDYNYSELINWIKNTIRVVKSSPEYIYNSYLVTIEGIFNPTIDSEKALTNWFMKEFYLSDYMDGNKYGFSFIAESYINGSAYLTIIPFSFYGYLFKKLTFQRSHIIMIVNIIISILMYKLFRSESYNFFRSLIWSYIIPLLLIHFIGRLFKKDSY